MKTIDRAKGRSPVKPLLALLTTALLGVCAGACGSASTGAESASHVSSSATATGATTATSPSSTAPAPAETKADSDKDNDIGAASDDNNNNAVLNIGHAASTPDRQAITALIKYYYTVALTEDGAKACSMIYSTLAEAIPEDYGTSPPGPPYMRGTTCPAIMTLFFKHFHNQLAAELPKLQVTRVRLEEHHGLAVLNGASSRPVRATRLKRRAVWSSPNRQSSHEKSVR